MQSHTRRFPRHDTVEGIVARGKREHAEQRRKLWLAIRPAVIVAVLLLAGYLLGVTTK